MTRFDSDQQRERDRQKAERWLAYPPGTRVGPFTLLTGVYRRLDRRSDSSVYVTVACGCGAHRTLRFVRLLAGHPRTCGCLRKALQPWLKRKQLMGS